MFNKFLTLLIVCIGFFDNANAQGVKYEAFKLAEITMNDSWDAIKPMLDGMLDNLEKTNKAELGTDKSVSIFMEEFKRSISRENFTKMLALAWSEQMTESELKEALAFVTSPTGRKFGALSKSLGDAKIVAPILSEACGKTRERLKAIATRNAELERFCRSY